jgi:mevalonate kinase
VTGAIRDTNIGWGKVIILGEHAVVYGYPALAAALDRGVTADVVPTRGGSLRLIVEAWDLNIDAAADHPMARGLAAIADALGIGRPSLSLMGEAQIPPGAGLGSSAALAVAITVALCKHFEIWLGDDAIIEAASTSERILHSKPSGIDVALAVHGGLGVYRRSTGLRSFASPELRILVGPSGTPRSTAEMVDKVSEITGAHATDNRLSELGGLTDTGATALGAKDFAALGVAMNRAHHVLGSLGVSTQQLDILCQAARDAGAWGSKLTGAGGGGAVIAIAPRQREAGILASWKTKGVNGFVATVGG